ncbi:MAG: type VI secretion system tip protein VgrG [Acidobacteria bacterium]|nr:type VI secretion system tip protein VgrG [Acidobacteriota bacterium]
MPRDGSATTQETRLLKLYTPLGEDILLVRSIKGTEGISQLYSYEVECFAENSQTIDWSQLIGKAVCVRASLDTAPGDYRYFSGVVQSVTRANRSFSHTSYRLVFGPSLWFLTKRSQSRIFQQKSVSDILRTVVQGVDVAWEQTGATTLRDYCVQYRETDFQFASRLMEEEGLFYYFVHSAGGAQMIVGDSQQSNRELPSAATLHFDELEGERETKESIYVWEKSQSLRSGKVTLWDHTFELPHQNHASEEPIVETMAAGQTTHKLAHPENSTLEIYDYPGAYAQRFDGVNPSGGEQAGELTKIGGEGTRAARLRMAEEAAQGLHITARTNFIGIVPGHRFALEGHFEDDDEYVITQASIFIHQEGGYAAERTGEPPPPPILYMDCMPKALRFVPRRVTPKPVIHGTQSAVVVGGDGDEICTDKYGRIKVQMLWDRNRSFQSSASCWVRAAMASAGGNWGFFTVPRVGHEVLIAFEEGDPDRPIAVGSVYNPDQMPPYALPDNKTMSIWKTRSSPGGGGFNEIRLEDKKDSEQIFIHGQKDLDLRILHDRKEWIGNDTHLVVTKNQVEHIQQDVHRTVDRDVIEKITRDQNLKVEGKQALDITGSASRKVGSNAGEKIGGNYSVDAAQTIYVKGGQKIVLEGASQITLKVGGNFVDIGPSGVTIQGTLVKINCSGSAGSASAVAQNSLAGPLAALVAATADPGTMTVYSGAPATQRATSAAAAAYNPAAAENQDKTHWIGVRLKDRTGKPIPGQEYQIVLPGGEIYSGTLDDKGEAKVEHIDPGQCQVSFPGLADWRKK